MPNISADHIVNTVAYGKSNYTLISPKQFYNRINRDLDEPIGLTAIYRLIKEQDFPAVRIGERFFIIEDKVSDWLLDQMGKNINKE